MLTDITGFPMQRVDSIDSALYHDEAREQLRALVKASIVENQIGIHAPGTAPTARASEPQLPKTSPPDQRTNPTD